jgi:hypothetical protein
VKVQSAYNLRAGCLEHVEVTEYKAWVWDPKHQERFALRVVISSLHRKQAMQARARKQAHIRLKQGLHLHLLPVKLWERAQAYVHLCLIVWCLQEHEAQEFSGGPQRAADRPGGQSRAGTRRAGPANADMVFSHWGLARCELETLWTLAGGATVSGESTTRQAAFSGNRGATLAPATAGQTPKGGSRGLKSAPMGVAHSVTNGKGGGPLCCRFLFSVVNCSLLLPVC